MKSRNLILIFVLILLSGLSLAACGEQSVWQVQFDSAGGTAVSTKFVKNGDKVSEPMDPRREGFVFAGWYAGEEDQPFLFETSIGGDLTLTARWIPLYTVTFDPDGGKPAAIADQEIEEGKTAIRPAEDPDKDGFTFEGWYAGDSSTPFDFQTPITANLTLTAKWAPVIEPAFDLKEVLGSWEGSAEADGMVLQISLLISQEGGGEASCTLNGEVVPLTDLSFAVEGERLAMTCRTGNGSTEKIYALFEQDCLRAELPFFGETVTLTRALPFEDVAGLWEGKDDVFQYSFSIQANGLCKFVYSFSMVGEGGMVGAGFSNSFDIAHLTRVGDQLFLKFKNYDQDETFSQMSFILKNDTLVTDYCYRGQAVTFVRAKVLELSELVGTWTGEGNIDASNDMTVTLTIRENGTGLLVLDFFGEKETELTVEIVDNEVILIYGWERDEPKKMEAEYTGTNIFLPVAPELFGQMGQAYPVITLTRVE